MKISGKLTALTIAMTFPLSAFAVIIEGSFNGQMWEFYSENIEGTPEEKFFAPENYGGFTGTFWYDTDLAGPAVNQTDIGGFVSATYSGPRDWLHTTVHGYNGGTLELTSSGGEDPFSAKPYEEVTVGYTPNFEEEGRHDQLIISYDDNHIYHPRDPNVDASHYRAGSLDLEPGGAFLKELGLIQNASANINPYGGNVVACSH